MTLLGVLLPLTAALGLAAGAAAQSGGPEPPLRGVVVDAGSGAPVARARIGSLIRRLRVEADDDGAFAVPVADEDTLVVGAVGYQTERRVVHRGDPGLRIALVPAPLQLTELVVTASRRPERAAESAVAVTSVGRAEIAATASASVDRVLAQIPGLQTLPGTPTGADLSIRGINGARVLVLQDGEPAAGALLENRDLSRLSTLGLDRIEVVKGPLSALYGSDAIGGVVNLISREPAGPLSLGAGARAGDLGRREARLELESGDGPLGLRVDGGMREDHRVPGPTSAAGALARVWDMKATLRASPTSSLHLRADGSVQRERQRWQISADGFNGFNDNRGASGWLEAVWTPRGAGTFRGRVFAERYEHRFRQAQQPAPLASDTAPRQHERLAKGRLAWGTSLSGHRLDAGIDVLGRTIEAPGKVDGAVSDHGIEGYAQDSWALGRLLLSPAARLSWNSRWGRAATPSLAAAWEAAPALRLRAGLARGFRGPSFKELAWDFPNPFAGYVIRGNPDVRPEHSWQLSAGGAWSPARGLVADVEVYRNELRDLIELTATGNDSTTALLVFSPRNVSRARTQGVEVSLRWTGAAWHAAVEYSHLEARDRSTGAALDRRAGESARLRFGGLVRRFRGDATLGVIGSAPAARPDGSVGRQAAFLSANVQLEYTLPGGIGLSLGGDNLFNATPSGWTGVLGRQVYVGLTGSWRP